MLNDTLSLDFNDAARRPMGRPNCLSLLCCTIESENAKQQPCVPFWEIMALQGSRSITRLGYAIGGWIIQLSNVA